MAEGYIKIRDLDLDTGEVGIEFNSGIDTGEPVTAAQKFIRIAINAINEASTQKSLSETSSDSRPPAPEPGAA